MNPIKQNPIESAMMEGVAQIHPMTRAAIVELTLAHYSILRDDLLD